MHVSAVIVGAGHAGLAMSERLTARSIDHVVLERGEVANAWRHDRWDSLRLLTPNWHAHLPGAPVHADPDGFMTAGETAAMITRYAGTIAAPVVDGTTVARIGARGDGYTVETDHGTWNCDAVVLATGGNAVANVPPIAAALPGGVASMSAGAYRNPGSLPPGGVLVVGASATGVQLADELAGAGRQVTLAVGEHVRMPRSYRGRDVFWWIELAGIHHQRYDDLDRGGDLVRARHVPSPQLIGTPERRPIDLNSLRAAGIGVVGRLGRFRDGIAQFSGSLNNVCALADLKANRLLGLFDEVAATVGVDDIGPPERLEPTVVAASPTTEIDLAGAGITSVLWATGFGADHRYVDLPVFDHHGRIVHDGGVVAPGLYVVGLNVLRRRGSSFIGGAAADTAELAGELHDHLGRRLALAGRGC